MTPLLLTTLSFLVPAAGTGGEESAPGISLSGLSQLDAVDSMRVGGLFRAAFDDAGDELSGVTDEDVSALRIYDAQLWFAAALAGYEVFVKLDAGEATAFPLIAGDGVQDIDLLRDAWVRKALCDGVYLYVGQYKCPLVASGNVGDGSLAMIDRTRIGYLFSFPGAYQPGVALMGDYGQFHVKLAVQNGADGSSDGLGIVARGEFKVGEGAKQREGALDSQGFNGTFGVGYFKDDSQIPVGPGQEDFGSGLALDAYATLARLSAHAEILDADEELARRALANTTEDATPFSATVGYLITDQIEAFARFQDLDNEDDASIIGGGVNYYVSGHAAKWQVNVSQYDDDNIDGTILQAGLALGHSERY